MSEVLPFTYFGSKCRSFDFINNRLPKTRQYVEPYGGAATLLLNREPVPIETYNDLHDDIPHFFRILRDRSDELLDALRATPYSQSEHKRAIQARESGYEGCSDLERARLFFVVMQQSRSNRQYSRTPSWSYAVVGTRKRGSDQTTHKWGRRLDDLETISGRLTDLQITAVPATDIIETHDSDVATFYVDPPYVPDSRGSDDNYDLEMSREGHRELADLLDSCDGYVALSGYRSGLYDELYDDWHCYSAQEKGTGEGNGTRQEVLWTNYDADELGGEKIGDWPEPRRKGKQLTLQQPAFGDD